jgi:SAM-dependent methyltransferase
MDYRNSHMAPTKGASYDASFKKLPYRKMVWRWEQEMLTKYAQTICQEKESVIYLDFACGTGRILSHLESWMEESCGVDISPSMLEIAKQNQKKSKLFCGDISKNNFFPDNYFDLVPAFRFFLNAQQELRESVMQVLHNIIKPNGYLIFNIHMNKGCLLEKSIKVYEKVRNIHDDHEFAISIKEIETLVESANFKILKMDHFGIIPIYSDRHRFLLNPIYNIEELISQKPFFLPYSRYIIYICQNNKTLEY